MLDEETFLTELYVIVDDFGKLSGPLAAKPGPQSGLSLSEIVTLAIFGQWYWYGSERGYYSYLRQHYLAAFPELPTREQLNRLMRQYQTTITAFALFLADRIGRDVAYEALAASAVPTRNSKRRGRGWLPGIADYGRRNRLGFYEGVHLLLSVTPNGAITGWGLGPASVNDFILAETFLAARAKPQPQLPSVGQPARGDYVADKGFSHDTYLARWLTLYQAKVICAPKRNSHTRSWPKPLKRWLAGLRQVVETVFAKLHNLFRLDKERPHDLSGLQTRLAAKVALHNFCLFLNLKLGRPPLAFADLIIR